ncbi:MAG: selenocysteine-specific translation elongation factor, partial [Candidatus Zixiibacteriota bacterium]
IVVGTAGHIDHGKSSIVRRLTGTDPDRLPEERARGMTIDLGFAFYHTAVGEDVAFVDVPGHERFVRNMIAGAGGIDAVMLVVAADDGWMPQSEEHFQICRLLGVRHGWVVVNKCDLVEPDWLDLLEEELKEKLAGSFLDGQPVFRVSAETGEGFAELKAHIDTLPERIHRKRDIGKARLFIDRVFVRPGIGGVVTGTLRGGTLSVGQAVTLWPGEIDAKVRTLHSMNQSVDIATPGQRTAVSFTGIDREHLIRGGVVSDRTDLSFFREHPVLALSVELLADAPVPLDDRRRALVIVGTTEVEGEVRMFERDRIGSGEKGVVFFRPDQPVYALVGDHYVLRLPTPMVTLGGGQVLDHLERFPRRRDLPHLEYLRDRVPIDLEKLVISELKKQLLVSEDSFLEASDFSAEEIHEHVNRLITEEQIGRKNGKLFLKKLLADTSEQLLLAIIEQMKEHANPDGLTVQEITRLSPLSAEATRRLVTHLVGAGTLKQTGERYAPAGRGPQLKGVIKQAYDEIMRQLQQTPTTPPALSSLAGKGKVYQQAIRYMLEQGEVYKVGADFLFLRPVWDEMTGYIREQLDREGKLAVAALRDRFGITRKYVIPILEETDRIGLTRREGDMRVKGERFA